jgi:DNA-binding transcriptional MerR regulator
VLTWRLYDGVGTPADQQGILTSRRERNGYRYYRPDAPQVVSRIQALLAIGLPTGVIRQILPCEGPDGPEPGACSGLLAKISQIRDSLSGQAEQLTRISASLTRYIEENQL